MDEPGRNTTDGGGQLWKFITDSLIVATPAVSESQKTVFVGSYDKNFYAINTADGTLRWKSSVRIQRPELGLS